MQKMGRWKHGQHGFSSLQVWKVVAKGVKLFHPVFNGKDDQIIPLSNLFWQRGRQLSSQNTWKRSVHGDYKFEHIILHDDGMVKINKLYIYIYITWKLFFIPTHECILEEKNIFYNCKNLLEFS